MQKNPIFDDGRLQWVKEQVTTSYHPPVTVEECHLLKNKHSGAILGRIRWREQSRTYCSEVSDGKEKITIHQGGMGAKTIKVDKFKYVSTGRNLLEQAETDLLECLFPKPY